MMRLDVYLQVEQYLKHQKEAETYANASCNDAYFFMHILKTRRRILQNGADGAGDTDHPQDNSGAK